MMGWIELALRRDVVRRGLKVGAFVGTILVAINQGDVILAGEVGTRHVWQIVLTYCVPYLVSTYASVSALRHADDRTMPGSEL